jgi:hypothetical protein
MFNQTGIKETITTAAEKAPESIKQAKYQNILNSPQNSITEMNYNIVDKVLEKEKQHNKTESWNKLDKITKIQKLHAYAEKYGKEHSLPVKDIKSLKMFFTDCLDKSKLQKTKDVLYDKDSKEITNIPALFYNTMNHNFTLKIMDAKRVSTLKSLTPKRISEKNKETADVNTETQCI